MLPQLHDWLTSVHKYQSVVEATAIGGIRVQLFVCVCVCVLQAKYLAQAIVMGLQVVGRAFARALQQEYAGMLHVSNVNERKSAFL